MVCEKHTVAAFLLMRVCQGMMTHPFSAWIKLPLSKVS